MSIDIRWLTNGDKSVITVVNAMTTPITFERFNKPEDVDYSIRHYVPKEPMLIGPDSAYMFGVRDILYPDFPDCKHPEYFGKRCIAESCGLICDNYEECPYFGDNYKEV